MRRKDILRSVDLPTVIIMLILIIFGFIMIGSANGWRYDPNDPSLDPLMLRQMIGFALGVAAILVILLCPFRFIKAMAIPAYLVVLALLILCLRFGTGAAAGDDVHRWLVIGRDITIQPSELTKIALVLLLAWFFERFYERRNHILVLLIAVLISVIPIFLVFKEPDLSTALVLFAVVFACFFAARVHWGYIILALLLVVLFFILLLNDALSDAPKFLNVYQVERIKAWLNPDEYALTSAYQSIQSRNAIGSGGLLGKGLFNNSGMVPIPTTDFIFGIIGEELGLIGASIVMVLFYLLSVRILRKSLALEDLFSRIICAGIATMIAVQSSIHMGVAIAVLPNTGLPLPFISYGLSSLTANMIGVGLCLRLFTERGDHSNGRLRA